MLTVFSGFYFKTLTSSVQICLPWWVTVFLPSPPPPLKAWVPSPNFSFLLLGGGIVIGPCGDFAEWWSCPYLSWRKSRFAHPLHGAKPLSCFYLGGEEEGKYVQEFYGEHLDQKTHLHSFFKACSDEGSNSVASLPLPPELREESKSFPG